MKTRTIRATAVFALALTAGLGGCSGSVTKTSTPTTPTTPAIVINAPTPLSPADGTSSTGWPTLTVNNATRTGPAGPLSYRFDISTTSDFTNIIATASVVEGAGQTSFTPNVTPLPADQSTLYWRAVAIDSQNAVQSPPSATQSFKELNPASKAAQIAAQQGQTLWSGVVPPGTPGQATMGNGWNVATLVSFDGVQFLSPTLDELQVFDCLDRGMAPQAAIDWMHAHGYPTPAAWFPEVAVIGFAHQYLALISGRWDMVLRAGA
jgi:hypothetical protein